MIYVYKGSDRAAIAAEVAKVLGNDYEIFEGENLGVQELMNIFCGTSLFGEKRRILIKDLTPAPKKGDDDKKARVDFYEKMEEYVDTQHTIVIWESYTTQKASYKKFVKLKNVTEKKFEKTKPIDSRKVFDVMDVAYRDGRRAVQILNEIKGENDPYMFFGLMASQAIRKYGLSAGEKEKRVLVELSQLDMQMKSVNIEPWALISSFLLRLSSL